MGTRSAAFTAKIRNLTDFQLRLLHSVIPPPSGHDIANNLKYFSQTLLGLLREIQAEPLEMLTHRESDNARLSLFPSLDYISLHEALVQLVDVIPLVQFGTHAMGQAILNTISCLIVFLDRETIESIPFLIGSMMTSVPDSLHHCVINTLCYNVIPFTLGALPRADRDNYAEASVSSILMMVFQYSDNSAYHSQLLECLMTVKNDLVKDVLCVIAHGTPNARSSAANLLFHYWPSLNPTLYDRRGIHIKFSDISSVLKAMFNKSATAAKTDSISQTANSDSGESKNPKGWKPIQCQLEECDGEGSWDAIKVCLDHSVSLGACPESPPPLYLCGDCASHLTNQPTAITFKDMLLPITQVSSTCENKNCRSNEKTAISTCFNLECASYNSNRPIRYCSQCNTIRHNNRRGIDHVYHVTISKAWSLEAELQSYLIEAIVSLLGEAQPLPDKTKNKDQERLNKAGLLDDVDQNDTLTVEEKRLLSRYGVWLMVGLCAPNEDTPIPMLGRLLSALCQWFNATQYLPDDQQGATIERLKSEHIHNWLQEVCKTHFDVFVNCLLPNPEEYAKVGGHWETLSSRNEHIKEGFKRLFCLVPYELITLPIWEQIMPHWMEAIHNDIPEEELPDLKITLCKLLDTDMSPLGFDAHQMYNFIAVRFKNTSSTVQEQTLAWLQILSSLNIIIPMKQLLQMFDEGVSSLGLPRFPSKKSSTTSRGDPTILEPVVEDDGETNSPLWDDDQESLDEKKDHCSESERTLTCFILMLDILFKQMDVQEIEKHQGVTGEMSVPILNLLKQMLMSFCLSPHTCEEENDCNTCDLTTIYFQLGMDILAHLCPSIAIQNNKVADLIPPEPDSSHQNKSPEISRVEESSVQSARASSQTSVPKEMGFFAAVVNMPQIVTATVETVGELDMAANMPQEKVVKAVARAVTLTDEDVGKKAHATACVDRPSVLGEDDEPVDLTQSIDADDANSFWETSQGKFKFKLEDLPPHLRVIYLILNKLESTEDADVIYHMCECLKYLILHGEALAHAAYDHRGFLIWSQENKNIELMWSLLEAEWSHVANVCVDLLLHFITLPSGSDIFWKLCETHFHHTDWKVRFQAVEKVVVIGRFLTLSAVKQCPGLQAAIAHAFCFLIASLDDIHVAVTQRAALYLTSLPDSGLIALCWCLEQQFDSVIMDRPMIIQALHQLSSRLPDRKILSWQFFYNRFDALYLEAQIALEKHGDIAFPRDLRNSDMTSDNFTRKLSRAQDALSLVQSSSVKTLSSSLGTKWPYKRTMSAPANMLNRADKQAMKEKDFTIKGLCTIPCKMFEAYFIDVMQGYDGAPRGTGGGDDGTMVQHLQKAMDLEETDKDTLHLLIFLLMQYLSQPQHAVATEETMTDKMMNTVLRHVTVLMGYSSQENCFSVTPSRLRASPVFNAFLTNLPQVLDHNFQMGRLLLPTCLPILRFCPAPHRMVDLRHPTFSLWCLQPHPRRCWLISILTIMYKFEYGQQPLCSQAMSLILIVLNTIEQHFHRCKKVDDSGVCSTNLPHSRDLSQGSLGGDASVDAANDTTPPPQSPGGMNTGTGMKSQFPGSYHHHSEHKSAFSSFSQEHNLTNNVDETEPELEAIPESPKGDSPCQDSLCELAPYEYEGEKAMVSIQKEPNSKAIITEADYGMSVAVSSEHELVIPESVQSHTVTTVMASQIQAFDNSFIVKIHNAEFASTEMQLDSENRIESKEIKSYSPCSVVSQNGNGNGRRSSENSSSMVATNSNSSLDLNVDIKMGAPGHPTTIKCYQRNKKYYPHSIDSGETLSPDETSSGRTVRKSSTDSDSKQFGKGKKGIKGGNGNIQCLREDFSPQSPLSMMDVITVGSPIEVDANLSTTVGSPTQDEEELELPTPERLLPVGVEKGNSQKSDEQSSVSIIERVWQALGGWGNPATASGHPKGANGELIEVVAHKSDAKKVTHSNRRRINEIPQNSMDDATEISFTTTNESEASDTVPDKSTCPKPAQRPNGWRDIPADYGWTGPTESSSTCDGSQRANQGPPGPTPSSTKQSSLRVGEDCMAYRCMECGEIIEEFSNEDLGLCIIILSTYVHRQPGLAAPLLPRMLKAVARVSGSEVFCWQYESFTHLPGSGTSIGRQFLRCVLHQLAPNQIFNQIFQTKIQEKHRIKLFKTLAQSLTDFNELNPSAPIQLLLENLNTLKVLPTENLSHILGNVASYMECVAQDGTGGLNASLVPLFDAFFRKLQFCFEALDDVNYLLRIFIGILRIQGVPQHKSILEPMSKIMSYAIQNGHPKYEYMNELCYLCNRTFSRERDKLLIPRLVVFELVQALKFKTFIPDTNLIILTQLVVQDSGGTLGSNNVIGEILKEIQELPNLQNNCTAECMRPHFQDGIDFIADVHTLSKVKVNSASNVGLNEDTIGGVIKSGIAQYLALECSRTSLNKDMRSGNNISKLLPWLTSSPTASNQGPKEFIECVSHMRVLSWVLLGALSHTCHKGFTNSTPCQPVPPDASCIISDHIQSILAGFPEQSKASVMHMSSLFHAFILCQLWTVYLEQLGGNPNNDNYSTITSIMTDFWAKVTPGILQLVSHSKILGEMVSLHFISLMEALLECQSSVLTKLLPLWAPVLYTNNPKISGQLAVRLQCCQDAAPFTNSDQVSTTSVTTKPTGTTIALPNLLAWLHRLQFKMGQIELQSAAATQFYSV